MKLNFAIFLSFLFFSFPFRLQAQNATDIVKEADQKMRGEYSTQEMKMTIVRPDWERTIGFKLWSRGTKYTMIYITEPPKEKGQVFMKRENEMWNWVPSIERLIKLPPSMMMQSWMGSDFTNDDLVKESSIINDYTHELLGSEQVSGADCYKIKLTPKPEAAVVWGKIIIWISKDKVLERKAEFYDEDGYLVNIQHLDKVQNMDGREIPTHWEMIPAEEEGRKTVIDILKADFGTPIQESFFSQQNMKRIR